MKKLTLVILLIFSCISAWGADFEKGSTAYQSGDFATVLAEWKPLAEQGFAGPQAVLGLLYDNGNGVIEDDKEAVRWYRLAADQGCALAQYGLGVSYANGNGVIKDDKEAVRWYRLAAEQGYVLAQHGLGVSYANGKGVIKDYRHAHMWLNVAASNGHNDAKHSKDVLAKQMISRDIAIALDLARECVKKNYKDC